MLHRYPTTALLFVLALVHSAWSDAPTTQAADSYRNPVAANVPDPFVIRDEGIYYLYGTTSPAEGFHALSSRDLVHWKDCGFCFRKTDTTWGQRNFWAPCVVKRDGAFYMFYSAMGQAGDGKRQSHRICVAKADAAVGPFADIAAPLLDIGRAVIDAHVVSDDASGKTYLYYALDMSEHSNSSGHRESDIYVVALSDDLKRVGGEPALCLKPDQPWEGDPACEDCWNEAPFAFKHGEYWILMYSARGFFESRYSVGYATSRSPAGPFVKAAENPILHQTDAVSGPGHNCVIHSPDDRELFCVYHIHRSLTGGRLRDLAIDRMTIEGVADGPPRVRVSGPTRTTQPVPSGPATTRPEK